MNSNEFYKAKYAITHVRKNSRHITEVLCWEIIPSSGRSFILKNPVVLTRKDIIDIIRTANDLGNQLIIAIKLNWVVNIIVNNEQITPESIEIDFNNDFSVAWVIVVPIGMDEYIKTECDDTEKDNLDKLPTF